MESAALVADGVGMTPDRITQSVEPVFAEQRFNRTMSKSHRATSPACGKSRAVSAPARNASASKCLFYFGAPEPKDQILIKGMTDIDVTIKEGIAGDQATVAILINAIAPTLAAKPGLLTPTGKSIAEISWRCAVDLGY